MCDGQRVISVQSVMCDLYICCTVCNVMWFVHCTYAHETNIGMGQNTLGHLIAKINIHDHDIS